MSLRVARETWRKAVLHVSCWTGRPARDERRTADAGSELRAVIGTLGGNDGFGPLEEEIHYPRSPSVIERVGEETGAATDAFVGRDSDGSLG
jgi:hypothetical protein